MQWEVVIGLEIHSQLATQSKIFSGSATTFGAEPNTQASLVDLGMPGVLPVLNQEAVRMAVMFGIAVDAEIGQHNVFARKNYFYPDLPKGYQISQMELPIVGKGHLDITLEDGTVKRVGITRAHLEEDAGKSLHEDFSALDAFTRTDAGVAAASLAAHGQAGVPDYPRHRRGGLPRHGLDPLGTQPRANRRTPEPGLRPALRGR